jgi:uncharacterized membrane protein HdeD (DUF308 family)
MLPGVLDVWLSNAAMKIIASRQKKAMKYLLRRTSMMFVTSGLVKIAAGIAICLWPISDFTPLIYLFGVPAILQGIVHVSTAFQFRAEHEDWLVLLIEGIIYLLGGILVVAYPGVTPAFLMVSMAITWSLVGIITVMMSVQLNRESQNQVGLLMSGVLSIIAGVYLFTNLNREVYLLLWILVIYSFIIGTLNIIFGMKARNWQQMHFDDYME